MWQAVERAGAGQVGVLQVYNILSYVFWQTLSYIKEILYKREQVLIYYFFFKTKLGVKMQNFVPVL